VGHDADAGQRPVEARARPVAPRDRLVDARGEQQLGRDLAPPFGHPDLVAGHARAAPAHPVAVAALPSHPLGVDGVAQAVVPLQLMHDPIAAPAIVAVAHGAAVEVDARGDDVDVILGMAYDDIGHVDEAHPGQIVPREGAPALLGQPLPLRQPQRAVIDHAPHLRVQGAQSAELGGERAGGRAGHVGVHDVRVAVANLRALLEHVVEHAPEPAPDLRLLDHVPATPRSPRLRPRRRPRPRRRAASAGGRGPPRPAAPPRRRAAPSRSRRVGRPR